MVVRRGLVGRCSVCDVPLQPAGIGGMQGRVVGLGGNVLHIACVLFLLPVHKIYTSNRSKVVVFALAFPLFARKFELKYLFKSWTRQLPKVVLVTSQM